MKTLNYIVAFSALALSLASCKKVLEKRDLVSLQDDLVFSDSVLARTYVDYIYDQNLPQWGGTNGLNANLSDEAGGESKYFEGTLTVSDVTDFGTSLSAANNWGKIRTINIFLEEIEKGTLTPTWKEVLKGQAYFFRAWRYFELVKLYGGVPLVLTPQEAVGDEAKEAAYVPRNSTSACFTQIAKDLDMAIERLPGRWTDENNNWGRVTSGAAAALKGRVLQYWASPQFNPNGLTDRWQAAYDASVQAKTLLSSNGYGLHSSFENLWFTEKGNPEAVFLTGYNNSTGDQTRKNSGYDNSTRPSFAGTGGGSNLPARELVISFPMKDGKMAGDPTSKYTYDPQTFYNNRDPRFEKTIAYNGSVWTLNNTTFNKFWIYNENGTPTVGPNGNKVTSNTGYFLKKAIDPAVAAGNVQYSGTDWIEIRYAEVLLNLAEAACGVNKLDEAYEELKAIRKRAGVEEGADGLYGLQPGMSQAEMFKAVLFERQIELAFEGKRYWDLRRWKLFESLLNGTRRTGNTYSFKPSATIPDATTMRAVRDLVPLDELYLNNFNFNTKVLDTKYAINWKPEYYFFAIPQSAINNNPKLDQNIGWGGTFDPLK